MKRVVQLTSILLALAPLALQPAQASRQGNMKAECKGAAAGMFGTRPVYVSVGPVWPATDGFSIEGSVDKGDEGIKPFNCIFDKHRKLKEVVPLISDGE